jgi:hypothetical protein
MQNYYTYLYGLPIFKDPGAIIDSVVERRILVRVYLFKSKI